LGIFSNLSPQGHRLLKFSASVILCLQEPAAKRKTENGSGLGVFRWVVERTLSWLHQFRRLRVRYERRDDTHEAFLVIGCILICANFI
jgi:transposase